MKNDAPRPSAADLIDPDPFAVAFAILSIIFGGGAYLETRRQREFVEQQGKEDFRRAWFNAQRSMIHARRVVDEFATYVAEDGFGTQAFIFGKVKLVIDRGRVQQLKRLHGQAHLTAEHLADDLDALAEGLDSSYQPQIDAIQNRLKEITQFPENYREVVRIARGALELYAQLLEDVGDRERFDTKIT